MVSNWLQLLNFIENYWLYCQIKHYCVIQNSMLSWKISCITQSVFGRINALPHHQRAAWIGVDIDMNVIIYQLL